MKAKISPRIDQRALDKLEKLFGGIYPATKYVLEGFPALYLFTIQELRGKFPEGDLLHVLSLTNGLILTPQLAGQHLIPDCRDSPETPEGMVERLEGLTIFQLAVLEIWGRAYWENSESVDVLFWVRQLL